MVMPYGFDSRFSHHKKASTLVLAFFVLEIVIDPSLCYAQIGFAFLPKKKSACKCKLGRNSSLGSLPVSTVASTSVLAFFVHEIVIKPSLCYAQIGFAFLARCFFANKTTPVGNLAHGSFNFVFSQQKK